MLHWACADIIMRGNPLTDMTDNTEDANPNRQCLHIPDTQTWLKILPSLHIVKSNKPYLPPANEVWGKVICLQVCVCPQGEYLTRYPPGPGTPPRADTPREEQTPPSQHQTPPPTRYTPRSRHPPWSTPPTRTEHAGRYGQRAAASILLECNLVLLNFHFPFTKNTSFLCNMFVPDSHTCMNHFVWTSTETGSSVTTLIVIWDNGDTSYWTTTFSAGSTNAQYKSLFLPQTSVFPPTSTSLYAGTWPNNRLIWYHSRLEFL